MSSELNLLTLTNIVKDITYKDWKFIVSKMGDGFYIQIKFIDIDIELPSSSQEQSCRKWYISRFSTKSEIVQTCLQACLKAEEHECREHFKYKNQAIYLPHYNVDELHDFCSSSTKDTRP